MKTFTYGNYTLGIRLTTYTAGGLAVILVDMKTAEPFAKLSIYSDAVQLEQNEFICKNYSENSMLANAALASKLFEDTGKLVDISDYVTSPIWRLSPILVEDKPVEIITEGPYAVICPMHKQVFLSRTEYMRQMFAPDSRWKCPLCKQTSDWDDDNFEKWNEEHRGDF